MKRFLLFVLFLAVVAGGAFAYQNLKLGPAESKAQAKPAPRPVPVVVAAVQKKAMPVRVETIGTVQPLATVVVKSRIDGQIAKVHIKDGQEVKAGDILFTLDSRALEAQLKQAEAMVAKDRAQLANAKREAERQGELVTKNYTSTSKYEEVRTQVATFEASVRSDEAAAENLKIQLSYTTIASPINGRAGAIALKDGNNVKANDTITLVTINQVHPIYVSFSVPQVQLADIREAMRLGPIEARVQPVGESDVSHDKGTLAFIDNAIDVATGTVNLKAIFENKRDVLWPGQFVNVRLTLRVEPNATVVPQAAVQIGQNGTYVYVAKPDDTAEARPVKVGRTVNGETVVTEGLGEGERVVVDGQLRLTSGAKIDPRKPEAPKAGATS
jgi:membrane fusion protein, multidrug efflux system